jgi:adenosylmethionine-8-amino-7-oxononanoate aminotransferase
VRGIGLLGAVELVRDRGSKELFDPKFGAARRVWLTALANGVIVRPLSGDVLGISPPFVISEQEVDRVVEVVGLAIASVQKGSHVVEATNCARMALSGGCEV